MGYFDTEKGVKEYIKIVKKHNRIKLVEILRKYLPDRSSVLEIGIGPGIDLDNLQKYFTVTGSDSSNVFLELYKTKNKNVDLIPLDAVTLQTEKKFDCIYSNKVLHHLTQDDLKKSLSRQIEILNPNGVILHSFWRGNKTKNFQGLFFQYYEIEQLQNMAVVKNNFEVLDLKPYMELGENDSFYIVLKKKLEIEKHTVN